MSVYRRSSIPAPLRMLRTEVSVSDLRHLDVLRRILAVLDEPAASADALAKLIDAMPLLAARLGERFIDRHGVPTSTTRAELVLLGNRHLEGVLLQLLEDLTDLAAEQAGIPARGSVFPPLTTLSMRPPPEPITDFVVPRDEPIDGCAFFEEPKRSR
jgi:hypothetical protein